MFETIFQAIVNAPPQLPEFAEPGASCWFGQLWPMSRLNQTMRKTYSPSIALSLRMIYSDAGPGE